MLGQKWWRTDTYAGINSAIVNPAFPARTNYSWDINLGEGTAFFANNYAYIGNTSVTDLFRLRNDEPTYQLERDLPADAKPAEGILTYDFLDKKNYYVQSWIPESWILDPGSWLLHHVQTATQA